LIDPTAEIPLSRIWRFDFVDSQLLKPMPSRVLSTGRGVSSPGLSDWKRAHIDQNKFGNQRVLRRGSFPKRSVVGVVPKGAR
jgi:hypothetical protein